MAAILANHAHDRSWLDQLLRQLALWGTRYGFEQVQPQRLSYDQLNHNIRCIQGLSQAYHPMYSQVMIKWQLSPPSALTRLGLNDQRDSDTQAESLFEPQLNEATLKHEGDVLAQLDDGPHRCSAPLLQRYEQQMIFADSIWQLEALVTPYYPLGSIKHYLSTRALNAKQKIALLLAAAHSIAALHQAGWHHGDIKPSNCLLVQEHTVTVRVESVNRALEHDTECLPYEVILNDFALAVRSQARERYDNSQNSLSDKAESKKSNKDKVSPFNDDDSGVSKGNNKRLIRPRGTPAYLAPECWQGGGISVQSDLYAFGIMMFEILSGHKPYRVVDHGESEQQNDRLASWARLHSQSPTPKLPRQWEYLQPLLERLLAKDAQHRYTTMQQPIDYLSEYWHKD